MFGSQWVDGVQELQQKTIERICWSENVLLIVNLYLFLVDWLNR